MVLDTRLVSSEEVILSEKASLSCLDRRTSVSEFSSKKILLTLKHTSSVDIQLISFTFIEKYS